MKTYKFNTQSGKEVKLEISYTIEKVNFNRDLDGYGYQKQEVVENGEIKIYVEGKEFGTITDLYLPEGKNFRIGNAIIKLTDEQRAEINAIITELKEAAKIEEEVEEVEIEEVKAIVEKAESQKEIPTFENARRMEKEYNKIYNEGGEGYVPHIIDKNEYEKALKILKNQGLR